MNHHFCKHLIAKARDFDPSGQMWCADCVSYVHATTVFNNWIEEMRAAVAQVRGATPRGPFAGIANFAMCAGAADVPGLIPDHSRSIFVGPKTPSMSLSEGSDVGVGHLGDTKHYNPYEKITCPVICYGESYSEEVLLGWDVRPTLQVLTRRLHPLWPDDHWEFRTVRGHWIGDKRFGDLKKDDFPLNVYPKVGHGG
jgi:hypothetical protein